LSNLAGRTADPEQARVRQRRAESLLRDLTAHHPADVTYQGALADSLEVRWMLHHRAQELPEPAAALDEAIAILEEVARRLGPTDYRGRLTHYYFNKTLLCLAAGQRAAAGTAFRRWMALQPTDTSQLFKCGNELMTRGLLDEAVEAYTKALDRSIFPAARCN